MEENETFSEVNRMAKSFVEFALKLKNQTGEI